MSKKNILPKFEVMIIGVFFLSFMVWAISRCNATKRQYEEEMTAQLQEPDAEDGVANPGEAMAGTEDSITTPSPPRTIRERYTPLYVTIDGLNLRESPNLDSKILHRLKLFEEVEFMGEVTDSTEEISLGKETADEPWVKVKSIRGHVGWVYGAGVEYYKYKHPGVE